MQERAEKHAKEIKDKSGGLINCDISWFVQFFYIERPSGEQIEKVFAYRIHKRKHFLKYKTISAPNGTVIHFYGLIEGRIHEWILYSLS